MARIRLLKIKKIRKYKFLQKEKGYFCLRVKISAVQKLKDAGKEYQFQTHTNIAKTNSDENVVHKYLGSLEVHCKLI